MGPERYQDHSMMEYYYEEESYVGGLQLLQSRYFRGGF